MEEDLQDLYENAPCGYLSLRADGRIVKANQTFCRWTGYAPAELIGKRLHDFLNIAGRIFYETHFAPLLRMQGFFNEVALDLVRKDGGTFPALINATERTDAEGKPQFIRLTVFNATDRRRYERELLKARDELKTLAATLEKRVAEAAAKQLRSDSALSTQREDAELREQFIAVLGHDLRNPLASISSGLHLIQRSKLDEQAEEIIILMQKSIVRMAGLVTNLLDFARGRLGGGITLTLSALPLEPVLRQVVDELQSIHPDRIIKTDFALTKPITADPMRIGQLFSNLLGNALTYGTEGKPVTVIAKTEEQFELAVCNAGTPIEAAAMERLFQPFSRGEVRPSQEGLGLGLYIASEIAKAHGGTIDVTSTPELTCFTLRMPLQR
ncbi:PAS domain-containing sensor histidine kinase [Reyranella sp.]|uniref:PAS domain-containing sensor histidine kinase n=1 Tax=Reyranella sp. TaxID=1929291 RepID=UPI001228C462|nr:PAS domain-containing sensor histidine kinase [Reyranella sp.]TAJ84826.1 MAG: PAS domain-containing sensor histidine kinase [Reyranella sp.]